MHGSSDALHHDITDVRGIRVGHSRNVDSKTGVTVILADPGGVPAGVPGSDRSRPMSSSGVREMPTKAVPP